MNDAPWAASAHSYAGWVPNVGSHLSFSLIGGGHGPRVTQLNQAMDGRSERVACVLEERETDDFLTWRWFTRLIRPDVVQHWILVGGTAPISTHLRVAAASDGTRKVETAVDEQGSLTGAVFMLPRPRRSDPWHRWMLSEIRSLIAPRCTRTDRELTALANEIDRIARWRSPGSLRIEFALIRTGELRLWYGADALAAGVAPDKLRVNARQAYFFLKDMVHHHTHHEPSSDQITPLVQFATGGPARRRSGEEKWRRETIWSLSRAAEVLIRAGKLTDLRQAMGILAYADAFQKTLLPYLRDEGDATRFVPNETVYAYDYAHIKDSARVLIEQAQAARTHNTSMLVAGLASGLAGFSLLSSLVSTHNGEIAKASDGTGQTPIHLNVSSGALEWFAHSPTFVICCTTTAVALISMIVSDGGVRLLRKSPRKLAQAARGVSLSLGRRLRLGARGTYLLLIAFYGATILALTFAAVRAPSTIERLVASLSQPTS